MLGTQIAVGQSLLLLPGGGFPCSNSRPTAKGAYLVKTYLPSGKAAAWAKAFPQMWAAVPPLELAAGCCGMLNTKGENKKG